MTQQELFISRDRSASKEDVEKLVGLLAIRGGRAKAKDISQQIGFSDRKIRALCEASEERVVGTDHGYVLITECSTVEVQEAINRLESQARKMSAKAQRLKRIFCEKTLGA